MSFNLTLQELMILASLESEEMYGYQILKKIESNILLGSLYNSLKGMERKGFVESRWGDDTGQGGRRKYYGITALGQKVLDDTRERLIPLLGFTLN